MASIGTATLTIVPKCTGLKSAIESELSKASSTGTEAGEKTGSGFSTGFGTGAARSGAVAGAAAAVANVAIDSISSHVSDAISRFDTLNNYPTVMQSLGYSADEASSSLSKMDEHLQGLPTSLDSMASIVQGIAAVTGDLDQATEAGLALNDMLLASGSNTQVTSAAMEQFRQILSKGKPDMQDWKSLTSAMPGQLAHLAEAMLGTGATANDLYAALGGGGAEATISTNDLLNAMIKLDNEGADGITSFAEQAKTATGGVQTLMENLGTAITRGLAGTLDAIGKENISGAFNTVKSAVTDAFNAVNSVIGAIAPTIAAVAPAVLSIGTSIAAVCAASSGITSLVGAFSGVADTVVAAASAFMTAKTEMNALKGVAAALSTVGLNPTAVAFAGVVAAVGAAVAIFGAVKTKMDNLKDATTNLSSAVSRTANLDNYTGILSNVGTQASASSESVDDLIASVAESSKTIQQTASTAEAEVAQLNSAQSIIDQYAGVTDLSSEAQGKLAWAIQEVNDQFGLNISAADVANNSYTDQQGNVQNLKESIDQLCESKKNEIKINAMSEELTEAYKAQSKAAQGVVQAQNDLNEAWDIYNSATTDEEKSAAYVRIVKADSALKEAKGTLDSANSGVSTLESNLGAAAAAASDGASKYQTWVNSLDSGNQAILEASLSGKGGISSLNSALEDLGVTEQGLTTLSKASSDDLMSLANSYDGSASSIVGALQGMGVEMNSAKVETLQMKDAIADAMTSTDGISELFENVGWDIEAFADKCSRAGLTTEDFANMSADDFAKLRNSCDGDMDAMVQAIAKYNSTPLVNKDGTVNVNSAQLWDAQNNVYTWNGTQLVDKYGQAAVDGTSVTDSTGVVWTWNGTDLVSKTADATITGNAVTGDAQGQAENTQTAMDNLHDARASAEVDGNAADGSAATNIWDAVSALGNLKNFAGTVIDAAVNVVKTITETQNAAGGIRLHASGGIVPRFHANGAIATKAVPLDIVGEDGAEAIVPLTNQKYSQPFVDLIADGVSMKSGAVQAARMVLAALPSIISDNAPNLVIDNDAGRMVVDARLNQLQRKAAMNRG